MSSYRILNPMSKNVGSLVIGAEVTNVRLIGPGGVAVTTVPYLY